MTTSTGPTSTTTTLEELLDLRQPMEIAADKQVVSRTSKHAGGNTRPAGWHQKKRRARKIHRRRR